MKSLAFAAVVRLSVAFATAAVAIAAVLPGTRLDSPPPLSKILIIGHRGNPQDAPENTLASIRSALDIGVDLIEVDVRLSKDGVPVILHAESVDRTTNGRALVANMTLSELKALDAGSWKHHRFTGERIPTLREALETVKGRGRLLLDVPVEGLGARIRVAVNEVGIPVKDALLGTWSPEQRAEFRRELPGATILLSEGAPPNWKPSFFRNQRLQGVGAFEIANWSPAFINAAHSANYPVYVYTINDELTMRHLIAAGADGIETDLPRAAIRIANKLGVRSQKRETSSLPN